MTTLPALKTRIDAALLNRNQDGVLQRIETLADAARILSRLIEKMPRVACETDDITCIDCHNNFRKEIIRLITEDLP